MQCQLVDVALDDATGARFIAALAVAATAVTAAAVTAVTSALVTRQHHALRTLDLSHNAVGAATASAIATLLLSGCSNNGAPTTSNKASPKASNNKTASSSNSSFSSAVKRAYKGAKAGSASACTCSLTALNLCHNRIGDTGAAALFTALQQHRPPALKHLALAHNSISKGSIREHIGPLLAVGLALTHLDLSGNLLGRDCAAEVSSALSRNCTLLRVELQGNSFAAAAVLFADALQHNSVLTELDLSSNGVPGSAAVAMAQVGWQTL
jgi:Ran GTPase-activating protein (RanGAP) involved in mRNA processing and transport